MNDVLFLFQAGDATATDAIDALLYVDLPQLYSQAVCVSIACLVRVSKECIALLQGGLGVTG